MLKNKKHITQEDFQRYLENQMTDTERNLFERELQKHPFEAEAMEGMQQFSSGDIQSDINKLSEKISNQTKRKKSRIWAAAATILLLVSVGVIWFQIKDQSPTPEMAQTKSVQESVEEVIPESLSEEMQKEIQPIEQKEIDQLPENENPGSPETKTNIAFPKNEVVTTNDPDIQQTEVFSEDDRIQPMPQEETVVNESLASELEDETQIQNISPDSRSRALKASQLVQTEKVSRINESNLNIVKGQVISLGDSMPLPGVTILQKGTSNETVSDMDGNFSLKLTDTNDSVLMASFIGMESTEFFPTTDSTILVGMEPSQVALEEVVVTGYQQNRKSQTVGSISIIKKIEDSSALPVVGMEMFKSYLDENAILPEDYASNRVAVRAQIKINSQGKIISVENKNDADVEWFNKAKDLILNGPDWNPKTINGTPVESEVTIRIVFKK